MELIGLIHEELLKSAELTGIWEKKLREIERRSYDAATFLNELKQMVAEIVHSVIADPTNRRVSMVNPEEEKKKTTAAKRSTAAAEGEKKPRKAAQPRKPKATAPAQAAQKEQPQTVAPADEWVGKPCPLCGKGTLIKGKTAYGCSEWRNGCTYRKPFA
jgi:DNA topoisomerase-3